MGADLRNVPVKTLFLKTKSSLRAAWLYFFVYNNAHGNSSAKALLNLVWIREAKKMRMTRITGMSHIYKKQLFCGTRT